jgi:5-methylcytosine-specific restriction protein B
MTNAHTTDIQQQLVVALDYMMAADSQNSNKHLKVREWFRDNFNSTGRASRVSETKQAYNRIPEQFKHHNQHVIFVVDDDGTGSVVEAQAKAKQYDGLASCLVLKKIGDVYKAVVLLSASDTPVAQHFKSVFSGVRVEHLGGQSYQEQSNSTSEKLQGVHECFCNDAQTQGLLIDCNLGKRVVCALLSKRFLVFAGLAGSGKTKIAQAFARWMTPQPASATDSNPHCAIIPVGADWTGNENIIGYPNGLNETGYITKPALELMIHAKDNPDIPHFLVLDEMNLSHVERYFADILSAIESEGAIPLHHDNERKANDVIVPNDIAMPANLFIIGTVNVDETTYMFSPKVLDRANVIEFRMEADEISAFLDLPKSVHIEKLDGKGETFSRGFVEAAMDKCRDVPHEVMNLYKAEMLLFFHMLQGHHAEFGYRTSYEAGRFLHFYREVGGYAVEDTSWFTEAMDSVIVQKLLPKLHGSRAKLGPLLKKLWFLCVNDAAGRGTDALKAAEEAARSTEKKAEPSVDVPSGAPYPLSAEKIGRMWRLLNENGFASFAEA